MGNNNNAWVENDEWDWIGVNKMSELESYKVATVDWGYHVYITAWEAAVGQILPCEREGGNIDDSYALAVVENNDKSNDNDALIFSENVRS